MCIFQTLFFCFGYCIGLQDPLFITTIKCVAYHDMHKAETVVESKIILRTTVRSEIFQLRYVSRHADVALKKIIHFRYFYIKQA
jgi:hypothetical protein